uniref:Phospholipid scramblase n=1 Tax=Chelonoidis abingdonii TaxID=106734 RepID=A0A8C0G3E1_CHEAB
YPQATYPSAPYPSPHPAPPVPTPGFNIYPSNPGPHSSITPYLPVSTGIPPGLEYLMQVSGGLNGNRKPPQRWPHLTFIGFETANKYELRDGLGRRLFEAEEQSDCCTRNCCGSLRRLRLNVAEPGGRPVLRLLRPIKCTTCWCPCCLQEFSVQNAEKQTVLRVLGPCCVFRCGGDINFEVKTSNESRGVGRISKQWGGLLKEVFTDTDVFGIQFPVDLDVKMKAVLLGACFLIVSVLLPRHPTASTSKHPPPIPPLAPINPTSPSHRWHQSTQLPNPTLAPVNPTSPTHHSHQHITFCFATN